MEISPWSAQSSSKSCQNYIPPSHSPLHHISPTPMDLSPNTTLNKQSPTQINSDARPSRPEGRHRTHLGARSGDAGEGIFLSTSAKACLTGLWGPKWWWWWRWKKLGGDGVEVEARGFIGILPALWLGRTGLSSYYPPYAVHPSPPNTPNTQSNPSAPPKPPNP